MPESFLAEHPEVPWRGVLGQRNVLAHEYDGIRIDVIWAVATRDTPKLLRQLEQILAAYSEA